MSSHELGMARVARADVFGPLEVSTFHCINRCVRRCFLCGIDPLTGKDYEHRSRSAMVSPLSGAQTCGRFSKTADYIIDLGPGAADEGGQVVACGTPEQIAHDQHSETGRFLRG